MNWKEGIRRLLGLSSEEAQDGNSSITAINVRRDRVVTTSVVQGFGKQVKKTLLQVYKLILILLNLSRLKSVASITPEDSGPSLVREEPQSVPPRTLHDFDPVPSRSKEEEQEVLLIIEQALKDGVTVLDLSGRGITKLPPEIGQLTNLTTLSLERNQLSSLPAEIGQLTNLRELYLGNRNEWRSGNNLSYLPVSICHFNNLTILELSYNQLTTLPAEIGQLTNLIRLSLSGNRLSSLPAEIGQLINLTTLSLEGNELSSLPTEIGQLTNLIRLFLGGNQLSTLPAEIGQLTNLTSLSLGSLGGNELSTLPAEIGQLTNLMTLNLDRNYLSSLPAEIGQLTNLTELLLYDNNLSSLPAEIGQLTNLTTLSLEWNELSSFPAEFRQLTNLRELYLHDNRLSNLPGEIWKLTNLTELSLHDNQLSSLPAEIGQLTNLTTLFLQWNQLSSLPAEIGQLTNLTALSLGWNQLSSLPAEIGQLTKLTTLYLSHNQLSTLPPEISQLTNLKWLDLRGNPIPPEILRRWREPSTILDYYSRGRRKKLNEAKLVLVGEGRVGKTSLVRRLVEERFEPSERITEGIAIKEWKVTVGEAEITLNIWDFGGQEIMHATHQFFLTLRTLYVLVLDAQQDEARNRLEYWLKLISSFGVDSPIIVVSNQIDQLRKLFLNQGALRKSYPQIKAFVNTSCKTAQGLVELVGEIKRLIGSLRHVRDELPIEWLAIKSRLEGLGRDYVAYDDYERLCEANDVRKEREQRTLIRLLHDLGVVLNFQEDPRLRDTSVLNPAWVTGGVYQIINAKQIQENKGILEIGQLDTILERARYPKEMHWFILSMMRKFELCFDLEGHTEEKFLLPDLLPWSEPPFSWYVDTLNFELTYDFLPRSVISRLMVRMHGFISQDLYWRHGVLLVHNANRALVRALPRSKKIVISISGALQDRLHFWRMIREQFDEIHQSIKGLNATVKIPVYKRPTCPNCRTLNRFGTKSCEQCGHPIPVPKDKEPTCQRCGTLNREGKNSCEHCGLALSAYVAPAAMVDYNLLLKLQKKGIEKYPVDLGNNDVEVVNVRQLLEGAPKAAERKEVGALKKILEPLRLRVHPQKFYKVTLLLGQLYYEEMDDYTLARQALADGHEAIEALRGMVQEDEDSQRQLSAQSVRLYEMLVYSCLEEGDESKAFKYAAAAKGRAFINRLSEALVDIESIAAEQPDFARQLAFARQKRQEIDQLERQIGGGEARRDELLGKQSVLLREEAERWREMAHAYPALTATLTVPTLSAEEASWLAQALDATLVEYYRHAHGWCAFVVMGERIPIRHVPLPALNEQLLSRLEDWRNTVKLPEGRSRRRLRHLAKLYQAAVAPLELSAERVILAPFESLHLLPLSATRNPETAAYLAEQHTLSYVPSLTALYVLMQEQKRRPSSKTFERLLSVAYPGEAGAMHYLSNVLEEAKAIANRLAKIPTVEVESLHEEKATPDNVLAIASDYDVIHFGCHGKFDSRKPSASGLMLAQKPLTVEQIITKLNLRRTRLVTLGACLTGEVALREGEEHIGLLQAMMTAGVQTVVASLWAVDDTATRVLFEAFYSREATLHEPAPAQAMREAARLLRESGAWKHPFYWAAFQVNGLVQPLAAANGGEWPPADLVAQMEKYAQQKTRQRSRNMTNEEFITNGEVLLEELLADRKKVLDALQPPYQLSASVASRTVAASESGMAQALRWIVQDNRALRDDFLGEGQLEPRITDEQYESGKSPPPPGRTGIENEVVGEVYQAFVTVLQQEYPSPSTNQNNQNKRKGLLKKLFGRLIR